MACVLRVAGRGFDVDAYIRRGKLVPSGVYRRGEARFPTLPRARKSPQSGFHIVVSKKDFADLAGQVRDAVTFLGHHRRAIRALRRRKGVETAALSFGVERRPDAVVQAEVFPEDLVRLAGQLGLALELSLYPEPEARS
jgi:hypothetical protein